MAIQTPYSLPTTFNLMSFSSFPRKLESKSFQLFRTSSRPGNKNVLDNRTQLLSNLLNNSQRLPRIKKGSNNHYKSFQQSEMSSL